MKLKARKNRSAAAKYWKLIAVETVIADSVSTQELLFNCKHVAHSGHMSVTCPVLMQMLHL